MLQVFENRASNIILFFKFKFIHGYPPSLYVKNLNQTKRGGLVPEHFIFKYIIKLI